MENYNIQIPLEIFSDEAVEKLNKHMKKILVEVCRDWDGVDFVDDRREGRVLFRGTLVDFRPPSIFKKHGTSCNSFFRNHHKIERISAQDIKKFTRRLYKEIKEVVGGWDFNIYICVEF